MNDSPPARPVRAETPPADLWQRWAPATGAVPPLPATVPRLPVPPVPPLPLERAPEAGAVDDPTPPRPAPADAPYRVLVVEDDRTQALFAQSVLHGAGMEAHVVSDAESVLALIETYAPDLLLMDLHLPGQDGMRLTAHLRGQPGMEMLPIVFLSGDPDPERRFEALDSGADDYLAKPIRPRHLIAAVSSRIRRARAVTARFEGRATGPLRHNPETGLPTRHHVLQQLEAAVSHGTVGAPSGGLFFIEIASALGLRERYGHAAFERLMVQAGQRLAEAGQPHLLARLNDNSFLLLAREVDEAQLETMAQALRACLSARACLIRDEDPVHLRGVVGFARLSPGFEDAGSALEAVERTALQARLLSAGVAGFVPQDVAEANEHLAMLSGQVELAYQPIVAVAGGGASHYQMLLRLRQEDGTVLTAGQVIPAAEAAGRIADLDQQVVDHALGLLDHYRHATPPLHLFVSLSLRTLAREVFADWLLDALQQRHLEGGALIIDVRLPDALLQSASLQQCAARLAPAGVRFCLSQFEPGAEANALLTTLPLSFVRMASRFAHDHGDPQTRDALRGAIEQARRAGLQIIGQQIEDPQAAAAMWLGGVDFIQGNMVQAVGDQLDFDFLTPVL